MPQIDFAYGRIYRCTFPPCFKVPEMVKTRPVVIVSKGINGRAALATVVPLSTTRPVPELEHHVLIPISFMPQEIASTATQVWAKCDMLYTLDTSRLTAYQRKRDPKSQKRVYDTPRLDFDTVMKLKAGIAFAMGINLIAPTVAPTGGIDSGNG